MFDNLGLEECHATHKRTSAKIPIGRSTTSRNGARPDSKEYYTASWVGLHDFPYRARHHVENLSESVILFT